MELQHLGSVLKSRRISRKISQKEAAARLGISPAKLNKMENGRQMFSLSDADNYLKMLNLEVAVEDSSKTEKTESDIYNLKLFDQNLIKFMIQKVPGEEPYVHILSIEPSCSALLPKDLNISDDGLAEWLKHRSIPKNRTHVEAILQSLGLTISDMKGIIDVCKGLSLNDSYWITKEDEDIKFSDMNLYENRFAEALGLVAWTGYQTKIHAFTTSPELTTNGMLAKAWRYFPDRGTFLYKQGTQGFSNGGKEPYSEYYASLIGQKMGLNIVPYTLEKWEGQVSSVCALFTDPDTAYMPIGSIVRTGGIRAVEKFYKDLGPEYFEQFASMLVFDALIYNEDRHYGNFGLLIDAHTNSFKGPAPLFDHGMSLLNFATRDHLKNWKTFSAYAKTRANPYGIDYLELAASVMGPVQKEQLKKLIRFKFPRDDGTLRFSDRHLALLERLIKNRVEELLQLPLARG